MQKDGKKKKYLGKETTFINYDNKLQVTETIFLRAKNNIIYVTHHLGHPVTINGTFMSTQIKTTLWHTRPSPIESPSRLFQINILLFLSSNCKYTTIT